MTNTVKWHNDSKTIASVQYHKGSSWEDFYNAFEALGNLIREVKHPVYVMHIVEGIPNGSISTHMGSVMRTMPDQIAGSVVIPAGSSVTNALVTTFVNIADRMYGKVFKNKVVFSKNIAEATEIAEQKLRLVNAATVQAQNP